MMQRIHLSSNGDLEDIPQVGELVDTYCRLLQLPEKMRFHLRLALDELLTNTISYGFTQSSRENKLSIEVRLAPPWLITEVLDNGPPFNPLEVTPSDTTLSVENRPIGGLGVHLVRSVIDQLDYRHQDNCNILQLRQALPSLSPERPEPHSHAT